MHHPFCPMRPLSSQGGTVDQCQSELYESGSPALLGRQAILRKDLWPVLDKSFHSIDDCAGIRALHPGHLRPTLVAGQHLPKHLEPEPS